MQALAQMRSPLAFEPMVAALKDASPEVRHQAAFSLGQMNDARAVAPLSAALQRQPTPTCASRRCSRSVSCDAKEAVPAIAGALKDDANAEVRQQAAFALGQTRRSRRHPAAVAGAQGCRTTTSASRRRSRSDR